jgi:hypothetical protein
MSVYAAFQSSDYTENYSVMPWWIPLLGFAPIAIIFAYHGMTLFLSLG